MPVSADKIVKNCELHGRIHEQLTLEHGSVARLEEASETGAVRDERHRAGRCDRHTREFGHVNVFVVIASDSISRRGSGYTCKKKSVT